jgi:SAM-dependent methyltransferase
MTPRTGPSREQIDLFLISVLILFLELACIRWFPAHVVFLTFFTNVVLLAAFLGMSIGCLTAGHKRSYLRWTPLLLMAGMIAALGVEAAMELGARRFVDVGGQTKPQVVFFGTEYYAGSLDNFRIPMEVVGGFFFLVIALCFVGPGQELGRALGRVNDRVQAYTVNILGSVVGIVLFALMSWLQLSPPFWFVPVAAGLAYFLSLSSRESVVRRWRWLPYSLPLVMVVTASAIHTGTWIYRNNQGFLARVQFLWSPYYRVDYAHPPKRDIKVNLIGHQRMHGAEHVSPEYALPHLLERDARQELGLPAQPFEDVLIIGAGSGNDVSRGLQWGAKHIDAVEIDPVIQRMGEIDHPLRPYSDRARVTPTLDDGRNFLRSSDKKYDLIIYALVDSLVLHSGYSNIRLESYLFTQQAFEDIKRRLKPGGVFVTYNYFRQGWIVARLSKTLDQVFGANNSLVFTWPDMNRVDPESAFKGFSVVFAGEGAERLRRAFRPDAAKPPREYFMTAEAPTLATPNGFTHVAPEDRARWAKLSWEDRAKESHGWWRFVPAEVVQPQESLRHATDDWPFLYLRKPGIPDVSVRGMLVMGVLGIGLLLAFVRRDRTAGSDGATGLRAWAPEVRMFFLGAGFMLVETKAVVHMALLFGSTWVVNSVVFFAILVMILLANLFVLKVRPKHLTPYYVGLILSLVVGVAVPLDSFLGLDRSVQILGSCLLVFAPILFAGVVFAVSFGNTTRPDRAFGANIAGAMLGGLAENSSMLLGFQYLVVVALVLYLLAIAARPPAPAATDGR